MKRYAIALMSVLALGFGAATAQAATTYTLNGNYNYPFPQPCKVTAVNGRAVSWRDYVAGDKDLLVDNQNNLVRSVNQSTDHLMVISNNSITVTVTGSACGGI